MRKRRQRNLIVIVYSRPSKFWAGEYKWGTYAKNFKCFQTLKKAMSCIHYILSIEPNAHVILARREGLVNYMIREYNAP